MLVASLTCNHISSHAFLGIFLLERNAARHFVADTKSDNAESEQHDQKCDLDRNHDLESPEHKVTNSIGDHDAVGRFVNVAHDCTELREIGAWIHDKNDIAR
jgi:hypothetical protein